MPHTAVATRMNSDVGHSCCGPIIRSKAPLRLSFGGGGTDLPHYYETYGGAVLSSTINHYAYVTLFPREDNDVRIRSLDLGQLVQYSISVSPSYDGVLDLAKAAIQRMGIKHGIEMDIRIEAPAGSGLGGSSAMTATVLGALSATNGHHFSS